MPTKKLGNKNYATKADVTNAIDNLAVIVNRGFERVEKGFEKIDKRFDDLQYQINRMETYILKDHQKRLEIIEQKFGINH